MTHPISARQLALIKLRHAFHIGAPVAVEGERITCRDNDAIRVAIKRLEREIGAIDRDRRSPKARA